MITEEAAMSVSTHTQQRWFASHVQSLMSTIQGQPVEPDGDGDFPIQGTSAQGWVRPERREPSGVHVFALAAHGLPPRLAVLREINEANAADPAVRVVLHDDCWLMVDYRLFADAVTEDNLRAVIGRVLTLADRLGPVLTALHGGSTPAGQQPSASTR
jgi:hypothetical protein